MQKEIKGKVQSNPVTLEHCALFTIRDKDDSYLVISTEHQASKDNIFVAKGQEMTIHGTLLEESSFSGILITEQAKISIKENASWK